MVPRQYQPDAQRPGRYGRASCGGGGGGGGYQISAFAAIVADLSINAFIARKDWMRFIAFAVYRVVGVVEPLARAC